MRNLTYPIDWEEIFRYVGFPAFLKPHSGGGWKNVFHVHSPGEFFEAYHQTGDLVMTLQEAIDFEDYVRCYCIGREAVHVMRYDHRRPHEARYVLDAPPLPGALMDRIVRDCLTLNRALGYDLNTVEFAVREGVPYAIDFLNPAPDADEASVGRDNFVWVVDAVAALAVRIAREDSPAAGDYRWAAFLRGSGGASGRPARQKRT
jgi:hypothetical protein